MFQIKNHIVKGEKTSLVKTPNHSGEYKAGDLDTIILHYTASGAESAIRTLTTAGVKASAHLVIARDGSVTQLAPFNFITWHAGDSSYNGRIGFNKYSIGIEIENDGLLTRSGQVYRSWYGAVHQATDVIYATHRNAKTPEYWHVYTKEQIETVIEICQLLIESYGIKFILGHEEIAPIRKIDPGPAFPLDKIRNQLLNTRRDSNNEEDKCVEKIVAVDKLNIRIQPDKTGELAAKPLTKGAKVKVLETNGDWSKVTTQIEGWVFSEYLRNLS